MATWTITSKGHLQGYDVSTDHPAWEGHPFFEGLRPADRLYTLDSVVAYVGLRMDNGDTIVTS